MDLSIIIVNWNSKEYLRKCIDSIMAEIHIIKFEIIVIDNASFDGCGDMLMQHYPWVRFIQSTENLGFAKANNFAFRLSNGKSLLFLNPDTELVGPAINIMFDHLQQLPNPGVIGCKLLNADKVVQTSCIQSFPTILNQLLDSEFLRGVWPKSSLWGNAALFDSRNDSAEVEAISGACMLMKRSTFEEIGLFSEDYFMYTEDVDLCHKMRQAGKTNYFVPEAIIIHYGGGSTQNGKSNLSPIIMRESRWRFLKKTRGKLYSSIYRISALAAAVGRLVILMVFLPVFLLRKGSGSWNISIRKWGAILAWSLGVGGWLVRVD